MTISPAIGTWVNFIVLILAGVGAGSVEFGNLSVDAVSTLKTAAADGLFVLTSANLVFHLYSSPQAGPLVK